MCDKLAAVHVPEGSAGNYTSALRGANLIAEVENATTVKIYSCFKSGGVTYKILSLSPKRVQVGSGFDCAVSAAESGTIHIPPQVIYGGISFTVTQVGTSAFSGCALSGAYLPDSVEYIGTGAFAYCANLESINLPERLESIANYAFFQSGLRSVVLPDSVTQIGWSVFSGASRLESATIGDGISSLANETFNNCRSLTDVTLTDSITRLENSAFSGCANLTGISLPASLEYIGSSTFSGCTGITSISMPASLRAIDSYAFSACSGLADINFAGASPPSLNGNTTFLGCDSLDLIRVPAGCTGAYRERLMDAGLATSVLDAASLKVLRNFTAGGVKYKVISADPFQVQIGDGISPAVPAALPTVEIPKTVESGGVNYTVTAVGKNAFSGCALSGVSLPDSVTSIGLNAFAGCGNLSEIDLPPNLNFIGDFAFSQSGLVSATIPGSVENFGNYAFAYSTQLESVVIKEGVRELSNVMFAGCTALTSVSLPDTLRNIRNAFSSCANLENISLPGAMETLAPFAFSNCVKLREISIPASVSSIGERAFFSCSKLSEITFGQETPPAISSDNVFTGAGMLGTIRVPDGSASRYLPVLNDAGLTVSLQDSVTLKILKSFESSDGVTYKVISSEPPMVQVGSGIAQAISSYRTEPVVIPEHVSNDGVEYKVTAVGREAFAVCNISGLTLPSGITSIGEMAFAMSKIREIYIPGSVTHFGDAIFYRAFELEKAEIGEGMAELPRAIFNHCKGLYFVKLPGTLKRISSSAFNDCPNLPEISIPASVEYIGSSAFSDCRELTSITFEGKIPPDISASNVFGGCISLEKLLVPRGTRSDYLGVLSAAGVPESIIVEYGDGESGGGPAKPTEPAVKPPADKDKDKDNGSGPGLNKPPSRDNPLDFSKLPTGAFKISGKAWTGKRIKSGLKISVSYSVGGRPATKALRENVDYNVTGYGKNKNIGKGTVTITGKAGSIYKAAISLSFKIVPKKPTGLKLKAGKKSLKVTFKKVSKAQKVKTYKVEYRVKGNKKWKSKTVRVKLTGKAGKKKTASLTLKKLKSKKTYQVRVYAYKGAYKGAPTKSKNRRIR
jgi:hypothetical protein